MIAALGGAAKVKGLAALRARGTIEAFELNPEVDEGLFENPQASSTAAP